VLTIPDEASSEIGVRRIEVDGSLRLAGSAFGTVDGTDRRPADVAVSGGNILVAFVDESNDTVSLHRYDPDGETWIPVTTGLSQAAPSLPLVTLASRGAGEFVLVYRGSSGQLVTYTYDGTTVASIGAPTGLDATDNDTSVLSRLSLASSDNVTGLVAAVHDTGGDTTTVLRSTWNGTGWNAAVPVDAAIPGSISTLDADADSATGTLYIAYDDGSSVIVRDGSGAIVGASTDGDFGGSITEGGDISLGAYNGEIYLFYEDAVQATGIVRVLAGGTWSEFSPADFTDGDGLTNLSARADAGRLFTGYIRNGTATTRSYQ
jgi:hypothetical protein